MKAVRFSRFGGPEVLELVELPDPQPGPGEIRIAVRAAAVATSDWMKRQGLMDPELPQFAGHSAAGIVDAVGDGVTGVAVGDHVFGAAADAAQATSAILVAWEPMPTSIDFVEAASLPDSVGTAARSLRQLHVGAGTLLLVNGASGPIGAAAVQLAVADGVRVIGIAGPSNQDYLRSLGAEPVPYGDGMVDGVRALAPDGVDVALDVAGNGVLPELIELAGGADHVITVADQNAAEHGVHFSTGADGRALDAMGIAAKLVDEGRFSIRIARTFPLADVAEAHRVGEAGNVQGKLVLTVD